MNQLENSFYFSSVSFFKTKLKQPVHKTIITRYNADSGAQAVALTAVMVTNKLKKMLKARSYFKYKQWKLGQLKLSESEETLLLESVLKIQESI